MVRDHASAVADAEMARDLGADLIELRVDGFFRVGTDAPAIERLARDCPLPCIVTCRAAAEGGEYDGDEGARRELYRSLSGSAHVRYLDVEASALGASLTAGGEVRGVAAGPSLILSMHDFKGRPADLARRVLAMRAERAAILKVAFMARSVRDNLELFDMLHEADRPTIALAMGEHGLMSRVLAPKFGGFLTFASLRRRSATAPGQPTIGELIDLYRFRSIGVGTRVYAILASPVAHSRSPLVHNAGFEAVGHDGVYVPIHVPGGTAEALKATLLELVHHPRLDFAGASISLPYKESLVGLAREQGWSLDEASVAIGAANTVVVDRVGVTAGVRVMNTDALGVADALEGLLRPGDAVGITGAGGMARAAAYVVLRAGGRVLLSNRTEARARALAADLGRFGSIEPVGPEELAGSPLVALINATSVGMSSGDAARASPIEVERLVSRPVVVETVYSPLETPLLAAARAAGLRVVDGLALFIAQAARQFATWTGASAPRALMERVARESLTA